MLPKTFVSDFGASQGDYVTFIDPNNSQFEVMVERIRDNMFLTIGFNAIRAVYDVRLGGTIVMVFTGAGQFGINVINRSGRVVDPPLFIPSMKFEIEKSCQPLHMKVFRSQVKSSHSIMKTEIFKFGGRSI